MNNIPFEIICPFCRNMFLNCDDINCDNCLHVDTDTCTNGCNCEISDILKEMHGQICQLETENEALLHERNVWLIFLKEKGE